MSPAHVFQSQYHALKRFPRASKIRGWKSFMPECLILDQTGNIVYHQHRSGTYSQQLQHMGPVHPNIYKKVFANGI